MGDPEDYFSKVHWQKVSPLGRDLLTQLLRKDAHLRPSVTAVLRHPWLTSSTYETRLPVLHGLPGTVRSFAALPDWKQLALAAVARELDDDDSKNVRAVFLVVEQECSGA